MKSSIPEPAVSLMSLNGNTRIHIKVFDKKTRKVRRHDIYLLRFIDKSHSSFRFIYTNKWRKDPKQTIENSLIASKYPGDSVRETSVSDWTPSCWVVKPTEGDSSDDYRYRIEFISCLANYHQRFNEEIKRQMYHKAKKLLEGKQIKLTF